MKRLAYLIPVLIGLVLSGCMQTSYDPYPYSFSDSTKSPYPRTLYGAQRFISDATDLGDYDVYPHWRAKLNGYVQSPIVSERKRTGDCDDYAVMMAYYLQEYWGYDTFIVLVDIRPGEGLHAVAYVYDPGGLLDTSSCPLIPYLILNGYNYYPVDWTPCPDWTWDTWGGTADFGTGGWTTDVATGQVVTFETGQAIEWYEMVNLALDETPGKDSGIVPIPAVRTTGGSEPALCGGPCSPPGDN